MNTTSPAPSAWTTEALYVGATTFAGRDDAERVARALVDEGLAACAQLGGPVVSTYRWEGKRCEENEYTLTLKFIGARGDALEKRLRELHPYTTPQWYAVRADRVSPDYLAWATGSAG